MALSVLPTKVVHRAGALESPGETPLPGYIASGNTGTVSWSDGGAGGTFSPTTGLNTTYTPANKTRAVTVRATDSLNTVNTALQVYGTFPLQPVIGYNFVIDQLTQVSYDRDGKPVFREDGDETLTFDNQYRARTLIDYMIALQFWRDHKKVIQFYYYEPQLAWIKLVRFSAPLGNQMQIMNGVSFQAQFVGDF